MPVITIDLYVTDMALRRKLIADDHLGLVVLRAVPLSGYAYTAVCPASASLPLDVVRLPYLGLWRLLPTVKAAGTDWCGRAPITPAHGTVAISSSLACFVCLVQVDEVAGGNMRRVGFRRRPCPYFG